MLDAFIIERIRQEKNRHRESGVPLRIDVPEIVEPAPRQEEKKEEDPRGVVVIDFSL